jgi:DNA-binding transcriptional MerR regulator
LFNRTIHSIKRPLANYSIRDLEKLSGIKAHTIRIWEQRYDIIDPKRTSTNIRFYTDEDLQYLLNVAFLNRNGLRISKISKMTREEITRKVNSISQDNQQNSNQHQALTIAMIELNEEKFDHIIAAAVEKSGFEQTVIEIIVPFLEKLSLLWLTGSIGTVHEQFINNLIRQKISVEINALPKPIGSEAETKPKVLLFEPFDDDQDILMLLIHYLLRSKGCETMYLGKKISLTDLSIAVQLFNPNCLFAVLSDSTPKNNTQDFINKLSNRFESLQILGTQRSSLKKLNVPANMVIFEDFSEFVDFLDEI